MQNLEKIEYLIHRYVLRLDIEQEYMHIYETGETDQASLRNGKNYSTNNLSELTHDAVLCEANFKNLRRVVLNPNAFVLKHKSGQYKRFDNQHIVDLIHSEMGNDLKSFGNSSGTRILKILVYRNVMTEEVINSIKETLKNRIEAEIDGLKSMLDYNLSNVFLNEYFYRACAKLDSNYFDEPLLILNNTVLDKSSPYIKERFTIALSVYNSESNLINQIFARDYNQIHSQYFKSNNKKQKLKSLFQSKPIITTSMIVMFFSILIKLISNSNFFEKNETYPLLPEQPNLTIFKMLSLKKKSILENQYFDTISIFKNCDFIIDNTQFKNFPTDKKRFKEIELVNNTNKDIIVIWFSANGTAYSFLSHYKTVKLTPYDGTLMLYAGKTPQNSSEVNSNPKFRFKEFTRNDSLLLLKEFNLNSIQADGIQYEVVEEEGEVKIKS